MLSGLRLGNESSVSQQTGEDLWLLDGPLADVGEDFTTRLLLRCGRRRPAIFPAFLELFYKGRLDTGWL